MRRATLPSRRRFLPLAVAAAIALAIVPVPGGRAAAADISPPRAAPPAASPATLGVVSSSVPFRITWPAATDAGGSGVARYQLREQVDGGSWSLVTLASATSRSVTIGLRPPHEFRFSVRAIDRAGNVGGWAYGPIFRVRQLSETTGGLVRTGSWTTSSSDNYIGGHALRSKTAGSTATFGFDGSAIAWIAPRTAASGSAVVSVDGSVVDTISLQASTTQPRRIVFQRTWSTSGHHALAIRVLASSGHPYVTIDGFVLVDPPAPDPTLVGAGDIASCSYTADSATAALLDGIAGRVFAAGDEAYPSGTAAQFSDCYGPTWGRWRLRTSPVPGNHEYSSAGAAPYFAYFGSRAGTAGKGWYAYDLGTWRVYNLNANCAKVGCGAGSEQERWLRADLAANPRACVAAVWHQPLFSSGYHGGDPAVKALWLALEDAGADVILNGHDHDYERFGPQTAAGAASATGIREFVVGTGGAALRAFATVQPNSEVRNAATHGVLRVTLHPGGYDWQFVPVAGAPFTDSGSAACH